MKNLKKLLFMLIGAFSIGLITASCNDDFSEEDLLRLQVELGTEADSLAAVRALAALNEAGELVSFQIKVVDTDGAGVEALDVTMVAAAEGGVADNQTLVTDASGLVFFDRVAIGGNIMTISGASILDATLTLDFGAIQEDVHYKNINGAIVPIPVTENAIITVLGTATATATVQGAVKIETDVTNTTSEVPQDLTLRANLDEDLVSETSLDDWDYFVANNDNETLGIAAVNNTDGTYTMTVPAGIGFQLEIPNISTTQRIAVAQENNIDLPQAEYRDVEANFGPNYYLWNYSTDLFYIPNVSGARVVFDAPPAPGEGFTFGSFARVGRSIPAFFLDSGTETITEPREDATDIVTQFTNLGSGYSSSPTVTITDATTGTGATAEAWIEYLVNTVTVTTPETGLAFNADLDIQIRFFDNSTIPVSNLSINLAVTTSGTGEITQAVVDAGIAAANAANNSGFGTNYREINEVSTGMEIVFPGGGNADGVGTVDINGRIHVLDMVSTGSGYTSPSFAFSGGGGTTQAAMSVLQFGTQWSFDVDNSGITTPYPLEPSYIALEYVEVDDDSRYVDQIGYAENAETGNISDFDDLLTVDGSGNLVWIDQTANYITDFDTDEQPRVIVIKNEANIAEADVIYNDIDQISGSVFDLDINDSGNGYTDRFSITVEPSAVGAPGSGVIVDMMYGDFLNTGEYQWDSDFDFVNQGSGFLRNLNQINGNSGTGNSFRLYTTPGIYDNLNEGDVKVLNIDYGTGLRSINFN